MQPCAREREGTTMVVFRDLGPDDGPLLARATLDNLNWSGPRFTAAQVRDTPAFAHYWRPPSDPRDLGLVAESVDRGAVGVGWLRHLPAADPGYGFVDACIPELSLWVLADQRGRGLGGRLLRELLARARTAGLPGISLSVEAGNPARRLYERSGFVAAGDGHDPGTLVLRFAQTDGRQ